MVESSIFKSNVVHSILSYFGNDELVATVEKFTSIESYVAKYTLVRI